MNCFPDQVSAQDLATWANVTRHLALASTIDKPTKRLFKRLRRLMARNPHKAIKHLKYPSVKKLLAQDGKFEAKLDWLLRKIERRSEGKRLHPVLVRDDRYQEDLRRLPIIVLGD